MEHHTSPKGFIDEFKVKWSSGDGRLGFNPNVQHLSGAVYGALAHPALLCGWRLLLSARPAGKAVKGRNR